MSVLVNVIGESNSSDEYKAALKLKSIIQKTLPQSVIGEIVLFPSASLIGQTVKDVDLFMLGNIQNYSIPLYFTTIDGEQLHQDIEISSFCTTIEVKSHDVGGVMRLGTDFYVKYGPDKHNVTNQSTAQKTSAMNFFKSTLSASPFITNLIWFTEISYNELNNLLRVDSKIMPSNVLSKDFTFSELVQLLVWQRSPHLSGRRYVFDSSYKTCTISSLQKALEMFNRTKESMGELTRKRIEQISRNSISADDLISKNGKMLICRGKAGTGKTVSLIQTAIKLVDDEYVRVLILTYNKALVSDIRRLFALAELPDLFEEKCVHISTIHSFYYRLINKCLYDGKLDGSKFVQDYEKYLNEIIEFIESDISAKECICEIMNSDSYLNWGYALVDEAQDWTESEKKLLLHLFEKNHIVIADGGKQFVRNVETCDWSSVKGKENLKLKYCLRQKNNLIKFINHFFEKYMGDNNKVLSADKMSGGKVIIVSDKTKFYKIQKNEINALKYAGNINYDYLYLVPSSLVNKDGESSFSLKGEFEKNDIFIWDGTNESVRESYTIQSDEVRVVQYDSARGLEAWTVCCMGFDTFIDTKSQMYTGNAETLLLQSKEEGLKKYIENWIMIAFTRAIDTLIIDLDDSNSEIGKILKDLSKEYPDYITWA
jgi:hypothetical protein